MIAFSYSITYIWQGSGSIYYFVAPGEITEFHRIDCDEYWCYNAGSPLEVWSVKDGVLKKMVCGITENGDFWE